MNNTAISGENVIGNIGISLTKSEEAITPKSPFNI
jgi:hypothetical protein